MPDVADLAGHLRARRGPGVFIIGVTGGVAAGKSTLSQALETQIKAWPEAPSVEVVCSDGFLFPNAVLEQAGLMMRKGFPESFDADALRSTLFAVRRGAATFPGYSHLTYDVDPALARRFERPDVLVIEGLGLGRAALVDTLVYLDAAEDDLETWFVNRFLGFWRAGQSDTSSFYAQFAHLHEADARLLARSVWVGINLPNLRAHILPLRDVADIVVRKAANHAIKSIEARERPQ